MSRQRLVIDKKERSWVTEEGDPPEVEWGDRGCTDREVTWKNIRFSHRKDIRNWDTDVLWDRDDGQCTDMDEYEKHHGWARFIGVPWDYSGAALYIVVVRYSDGDTFGLDEGYEEVVAVCVDEGQAQLFKQKFYGVLERRYDSYFGKLQDVRIEGLLKMPDEV
jgi:hypothetical protein